jgi:hypothetical protein
MSSPTEDFLSHYGVQGMKWGKRSGSKPSGGGTGKNGKVTSGDIHLARFKQEARLRKLQEAEGDFYVARTAKGQDKAEKIMRKHEKAFFNNPDAKMAARMTKGEKIITGLMYGLAAATVASAVVANTSGSRRM